MLRQRVRVDRNALVRVGQVVTVIVALAVAWYGVILGLLVLGAIDAGAAGALTGYRDAYDALAGLTPDDVDGSVRLATGIGGLLALLVFGYLALKQIPRPELARSALVLARDDRGEITLAPRAFERAAEAAALGNRAVVGASGRYGGDDISVDIAVTEPREAAETLRDVQRRVARALRDSDLPEVLVNVTVTKFEQERRTIR